MNKNLYSNSFSRVVLTLLVSMFAFCANAETLTVGYGTAKNDQVPVYGNNVDNYQKCEFIIPASDLNSMSYSSILKMEFFLAEKAGGKWNNARFKVYMREVSDFSFPSSDAFMGFMESNLVYEGALDATGDIMEVPFDRSFFYAIDNLLVGIYEVATGDNASCKFSGNTASYAALVGTSNSSLDEVQAETQDFLPTTRFTYTREAVPSLSTPTNLVVTDIKTTSAVVSWTSEASQFELCINNDASNLISVYGNSYELTNLEVGTNYEVKVRAVSNDTKSLWSETVSFTTILCDPENQMTISYHLTDSYGDGWDGNAIEVWDASTDELITTWTIESGSETSGTLSLCMGRTVIFKWVQGSYSSECSYEVLDGDGEVIFSGNNAMPNSVEYTVSTVKTPNNLQTTYDLTGEDISVVVNWEQPDNADRWEYCLDGGTTTETDHASAKISSLTKGKDYTFKVRAFKSSNPGLYSKWSKTIILSTKNVLPAPENIKVSEVSPTTATISWEGEADGYNLRYRKATQAEELATVTLTVGNVWGDGTGYQMLLDADATAYGAIIPETGGLSAGDDVPEETYSEFEYKIPNNADGSLTTSNFLINASVTITIPAGIYDWCITNPTPGDRMWIASSSGNVGGRQDNYLFEPGKAYEFTVYSSGTRDAVDVTVTDATIDVEELYEEGWTLLTDVDSPCTLEGLDPSSLYLVQVQGTYSTEYNHETEWKSKLFKTMDPNPEPYDVVVVPAATSADISWKGFGDSYVVKYRRAGHYPKFFFEDFENGIPDDWTIIDADGDGYGWYAYTSENPDATTIGSTCATSASYSEKALTPDNWLITPPLTLQGKLSVWLRAQSITYVDEHFAIYVSISGNTVDDFVEVIPESVATDTYVEYTVDLNDYDSATGYIGIRHFNSEDMFRLNVDNFAILDDYVEPGETKTKTTTDLSLTLTGLSPSTPYEFSIESRKEGIDPTQTIVGTFTTNELGVATGVNMTPVEVQDNDDWYTIDGRKLSSKPAKKGIYLKGNKKVVVK
ncbi:MAG: DUF2436 domain-containing protein [Prevotella sp.]|nr:DUF2436 domain-containing protein [Prevotella sp.]